jgi:hypothetical protein
MLKLMTTSGKQARNCLDDSSESFRGECYFGLKSDLWFFSYFGWNQLDWDPFEDFFGLGLDMRSRCFSHTCFWKLFFFSFLMVCPPAHVMVGKCKKRAFLMFLSQLGRMKWIFIALGVSKYYWWWDLHMLQRRKNMENNQDPSIGYVPEGQYVKEMPCPTCRGRGYLRCDQCNLGNLQEHCPRCSGKVYCIL